MDRPWRGLALCGVTGSGKSSLAVALRDRLRGRGPVLLTNDTMHKPGLAAFAESGVDGVRRFLAERCADLSAALGTGPVLCESFAVNLLVECGIEDPAVHAEADRQRARLGIGLVHLELAAGEIRERSVRGTRAHRGPKWARYLDSLADGEDAQVALFERRRAGVARLYRDSAPPKLAVRTTDMRWDRLAGELAAVLEGEDR
jgi:hypothetical protein